MTDELSNDARRGFAEEPALDDARRRFLLALRVMADEKRRRQERDESLQHWAEQLRAAVAAYRSGRRAVMLRRLLFVGAIGLVTVSGWRVIGEWWWLYFPFAAIFGGKAMGSSAAERRTTAAALSRTRDPRAISVLAVACVDADPETRAIAAQGLKQGLPYLRASDAPQITAEGMEALIRLLRSSDVELLVRILGALEQVGDARAIPAVQRLSTMYAPAGDLSAMLRRRWTTWVGLHHDWDSVREVARQCLLALEMRAENERARTTLLRPAQATEDSGILLRPAGQAETPAEQLLRAVE